MALSNGSKYLTSPSEIPVKASGSDTERTLGDWVEGQVYTYSAVSDMEADESLTVGAKVRTLGYYSAGDGGGNVYEIVASGTGTDDGGSYIDLSGSGLQAKGFFPERVNVKQFGAVTDGDGEGAGTDNTTFINTAYAHLEGTGKTLYFPSGIYSVRGRVSGKGGMYAVFEEGAIVDLKNSSVSYSSAEKDGAWEFRGQLSGPEINTAANVTVGDTTITTTANHGLSVGDIFLIKSQRNSLYSDAGDYRLGRSTGSVDGHALYFGEPCLVEEVVSSTEVRIRNGLIFPDYRTDDTLETSPAATRPRTTIQKIDFLERFHMRGGKFLSFNNTAVFVEYCKDSSITGLKTIQGAAPGMCVLSRYNYRCSFTDLYAEHPEDNYLVEDHSQYNSFKARSDWYTEWSYTDIFGMQGLDISYDIGGTPTLFPNINKAVSLNSFENGLTFHSGCYGWKVSNVYVKDSLNSPITLRSRNGVLTDFVLDTSSPYNGIVFSEWAVDIAVSSGKVRCGNDGFLIGTHFVLPGDESEQAEPRRNITMTNVIFEVGRRIGTIHSLPIETLERSGIVLSDIVVTDFAAPLQLQSFVHGVIIDNWQVSSRGTSNTEAAIQVFNDSTLHTIRGVRRNAPVSAPAVINTGVTFSSLFPATDYYLRATGVLVEDCLNSDGGCGVITPSEVKARTSGNAVLNEIAAREGVYQLDPAGGNRTLTLNISDSSNPLSVQVGRGVVIINTSTTNLTLVAGSGATINTSRYGSSTVLPGEFATVKLISPTVWVVY